MEIILLLQPFIVIALLTGEFIFFIFKVKTFFPLRRIEIKLANNFS